MENKKPEFEEKACVKCKYCLYLIALGLGLQCKNENNKVDNKNMKIHNRNHTCEYFEAK